LEFPHPLSLPTSADLDASSIVARLGLNGVRVSVLGSSRAGRRIEMLSIGDGPRSALVIGAPHPNEPTGCLTILRMLARFGIAAEFAGLGGWQWHFVPAIDIDGVVLNEEWFSDSPDITRYLEHFFRPPFRLQPEYSFPITLPEYSFTAETPESSCWREALDIAKPDLQCSLHGADTGGAFFILSDTFPRLADQLVGQSAEFGITLNEVGEPFAEMTMQRPGVFSFPSIPAMVGRGTEGSRWNAGDSSAGFAARNFGTFSMTCEVPLWRDAREGDLRPSGRTVGEVVAERIRLLQLDADLLTASLPLVRPRVETIQAQALLGSLDDALALSAGVIATLNRARPRGSDDRPALTGELVMAEPGTHGMRTPAMLRRLARATGVRTVEETAREMLDARLAAHRRCTRLLPVPLSAATGLQMEAILTTARLMEDVG
jgi:hypothetical protein